MIYLIGQMLFCLLAAAFLGFLLGWFLRGVGCREQAEALRVELDAAELRARRWETQAREWEARAESEAAPRSGVTPPGPAPSVGYVPSFPVEEIEGIGAGFGQRLAEVGVSSSADLLEASRTAQGRVRLADACGVDEATVANWATMADLLRIPGIGGQWAELLWRSGVASVERLGDESPAPLLIRMTEINDAEHRVPELPTLEQVEHWIAEAEMVTRGEAGDGSPYRPSYPVQEVEGIGAGFGRRLREEGIGTTAALLALGRSPESVGRLASVCEVPPEAVESWFVMADLLRVPGIGGQWAELLWRCEVGGVAGLAAQDVASLVERMERVNAQEHRAPELPGADRVGFWIAEAGRMEGEGS